MLRKDTILVEHIITEKATEASSLGNQYTFKVGVDANRISIKQAVEAHFEVGVKSVQIINVKPKFKMDRRRRGQVCKRAAYKKAIVRLVEGDSIQTA